jgi:hypothetical protein
MWGTEELLSQPKEGNQQRDLKGARITAIRLNAIGLQSFARYFAGSTALV